MEADTSTRIIEASSDLLHEVSRGQRLWSMASLRRIGAQSGLSGELLESVIKDWIDTEGWLDRFVLPGKKQERLRVTEQCPVIENADVCFLETVLELCGEGAHYGYRSALSLLGYSEEHLSKILVVVVPRKSKSVPSGNDVFSRSDVRPKSWTEWEGRKIWRVERNEGQVAGFTLRTDEGIQVSSIERCLLDCWLRPAYGVSDDRLLTSFGDWWSDDSKTSPKQKARKLAKVFQADKDDRPGRQQQFENFLKQIDGKMAALFNDALRL